MHSQRIYQAFFLLINIDSNSAAIAVHEQYLANRNQSPELLNVDANLQEALFSQIANNILQQGYSIHPNGLPIELTQSMWNELNNMNQTKFNQAGIGRDKQHMVNPFVRTDSVCWIDGTTPASNNWLAWCDDLMQYLNRRLFLGLFSVESHFAHYQPGDFYKRHLDAFKGEANRVLSMVVYLNSDWAHDDGGELVLDISGNNPQQSEHSTNSSDIFATELCDEIKVTPGFGTIALFLSEEFPHEVLPTKRDRYSIAAWFRTNPLNKPI
jgi:SM-20-related protein